jgi:hypothetical protein
METRTAVHCTIIKRSWCGLPAVLLVAQLRAPGATGACGRARRQVTPEALERTLLVGLGARTLRSPIDEIDRWVGVAGYLGTCRRFVRLANASIARAAVTGITRARCRHIDAHSADSAVRARGTCVHLSAAKICNTICVKHVCIHVSLPHLVSYAVIINRRAVLTSGASNGTRSFCNRSHTAPDIMDMTNQTESRDGIANAFVGDIRIAAFRATA